MDRRTFLKSAIPTAGLGLVHAHAAASPSARFVVCGQVYRVTYHHSPGHPLPDGAIVGQCEGGVGYMVFERQGE